MGSSLGRYQTILRDAQHRDVREVDTRSIVRDVLSDILGYDKYTDITAEERIRSRSEYCDLVVSVNERVRFIVEVKRIRESLHERHVKQAVNYAVHHTEGVDWVVLTNGVVWDVYRVGSVKPIVREKVLSFDLLEMDPDSSADQQRLGVLAKSGWLEEKARLEAYHDKRKMLEDLPGVLVSEPVLKIVCRELGRGRSWHAGPPLKEIRRCILEDVLKRGLFEEGLYPRAPGKGERGQPDSNLTRIRSEQRQPDTKYPKRKGGQGKKRSGSVIGVLEESLKEFAMDGLRRSACYWGCSVGAVIGSPWSPASLGSVQMGHLSKRSWWPWVQARHGFLFSHHGFT